MPLLVGMNTEMALSLRRHCRFDGIRSWWHYQDGTTRKALLGWHYQDGTAALSTFMLAKLRRRHHITIFRQPGVQAWRE
ncbi:hypothetical protein Pmani_034921 [Petrolisthes manimaculis]|uniref:Uncharacterized protein n=1 Tax=Petrolisthes manimaculis TaxID=1843537 RepID=A0AAE1NNA1_9EUCA|nr:hypothetical protein Pmani_034921 [Petrolisthes manimaculis]